MHMSTIVILHYVMRLHNIDFFKRDDDGDIVLGFSMHKHASLRVKIHEVRFVI